MTKATKLCALLLAALMLIGVLGACGGEKKVNTGSTFTYWVPMGGVASQTIKSYSELLMYQEMAKATGTEVTFIHPTAGSTGSEAFQILLSSGDYPDMMEYNWKNYPGGPDLAIKHGVIIALNDYMEDYAPNYYDYMEGKKGKENGYLYKAQAVSDAGNYYGFGNLNIGSYRGFSGFIVRKDLIDKWEVDIPVTIDDWTNLFKVAKENGVKYPLTGISDLFSIKAADMFNTAYRVGKSFYLDNGKVKFGPAQKAYREYIQKMAEWMKDGYVDPDYVTNDRTNVEGYMTNGTSIAYFGYVGSGIGKLLPAMAEKDPNYSVVACPHPVLKEGDAIWSQELQPETNSPFIAISKQCGAKDEERYKEAIKWCDYLYSDEGLVLKSFGVEGETFTIEKGEDGQDHYIYTDKIFDHEKIGAHSVEAALYHFMRPANSPGLNQHPDYLNGFYPYDEQKEAIVTWNQAVEAAKKVVLPPLSYTDEEATKKATIEANLRDNLDAAISNVILGKNTIEDFDKALEKAMKDGYDELTKITQAAYDRYISVIKESK